jgi:hypothetical protein
VGCGACTAEIDGDSRDISGGEGRVKKLMGLFLVIIRILIDISGS